MNVPAIIKNTALKIYVQVYNAFNPSTGNKICSDIEELNTVVQYAEPRSDINEHLPTLFMEAYSLTPKVIVELGTRGADSTFALEKVAHLCDSRLISVDLEPCRSEEVFSNWYFIQEDDLLFAKRFKEWAQEKMMNTEIDFLFLDTSHEYEHTKQEIEAWFPLVSPDGKIAFHDTNMGRLYKRQDGSRGIGWDNDRGVIRAIEEFLGTPLDETRNFQTIIKGWQVTHWSTCSGLTLMERVG